MTTKEVLAVDLPTGAEMVGLGFTKFREVCKSGAIPTFKVGTRRLVRTAALDEWLREQEANSPDITDDSVATSVGFAARVAARRASS